jgi:hypothetical protein
LRVGNMRQAADKVGVWVELRYKFDTDSDRDFDS